MNKNKWRKADTLQVMWAGALPLVAYSGLIVQVVADDRRNNPTRPDPIMAIIVGLSYYPILPWVLAGVIVATLVFVIKTLRNRLAR